MKKLIILSVFALFCVIVSAKIQAREIESNSFRTFINNVHPSDRLCIKNTRTKEEICDQELLEKFFIAYVNAQERHTNQLNLSFQDRLND